MAFSSRSVIALIGVAGRCLLGNAGRIAISVRRRNAGIEGTGIGVRSGSDGVRTRIETVAISAGIPPEVLELVAA